MATSEGVGVLLTLPFVANSLARSRGQPQIHPSRSPTCLMSSSLDTKRAALHDISNKGTLGSDKVREPRAASAMGTS